jgi:tetratricopeptide (TPR) repeat protein
MSAAFERAIVLYSQNRFDFAEAEFRRALAEWPDNPVAHAFLSLCLSGKDERDEALREAEVAVRLDPSAAFCHFVHGRALCDQNRYREAESAAREAIRLDPENADYFGLLASTEFGLGRWAEALESADRGLAVDPDHPHSTNLRAMALVQLGRNVEASQSLGRALANNPENGLTHANQGWALLHSGDYNRALDHFREALRLEPELEWARAGIVEALKARYLIYRVMLRFFLWMGRQSRTAQWIVILGFVFGRGLLASIAKAQPALAPFIFPVLALSFGFLVMTWISSPLFNLLLRFNRFGRLALTSEEQTASSWIGGCFLIAALSAVAYLVRGGALASFCLIYFGLLLIPLAVTFGRPSGTPRRLMAAYTGVLVLMGLPLLSMLVLKAASPWQNVELGFKLFEYFGYGSVLSTWIPALLQSRVEPG